MIQMAGAGDGARGSLQGVPTHVEICAPLKSKEQLKRYLRADRAVRTLRTELPRVFDRPLTGDIYAQNISMGGDILGGILATGRDEYLAFFNNVRRLQGLSLVLRVAGVEAIVGAYQAEDAGLHAAMSVRLQWQSVATLSQVRRDSHLRRVLFTLHAAKTPREFTSQVVWHGFLVLSRSPSVSLTRALSVPSSCLTTWDVNSLEKSSYRSYRAVIYSQTSCNPS